MLGCHYATPKREQIAKRITDKTGVRREPNETVDELLGRMTDRRIRHLPVCREGRLVGIISIGDLVKSKIAETVAEAETLKAYIEQPAAMLV